MRNMVTGQINLTVILKFPETSPEYLGELMRAEKEGEPALFSSTHPSGMSIL